MLSQRSANGLVLSLTVLCIGLVAALAFVLRQSNRAVNDLDMALQNADVREAVVGELVEQADGIFDSFPDHDVGRILLPGLDTEVRNHSLKTNSLGMREREYALPKPDGTVRVVLLGDSYVFGSGVEADLRVGAHLERFLEERSPGSDVECLHLGIPSWNIVAECAYVSRQVTDLRPDLVIQVVVPNDLDDNSGIRGFGSQGDFTLGRPGARIHRNFPRILGFRVRNYILDDLDYESSSRYQRAADAIEQLATGVGAVGGRYVLLLNWLRTQRIAHDHLGSRLSSDQVAMLPRSFFHDDRYRISEHDGHWNPAGHERVARYLYGMIQRRDLLPALKLPVWDEATEAFVELSTGAEKELTEDTPRDESSIVGELDFQNLTRDTAAQIYCGIYPMAVAGPYVSVLLRCEGSRLRVRGSGLSSPILDGMRIRVFVDEAHVGDMTCRVDGPLELDVALPEEIQQRRFVTVRCIADDYMYVSEDLRASASAFLHRVVID